MDIRISIIIGLCQCGYQYYLMMNKVCEMYDQFLYVSSEAGKSLLKIAKCMLKIGEIVCRNKANIFSSWYEATKWKDEVTKH